MKIKLFILALAGVSLAGCQSDQETSDDGMFPADGVVRVTTRVADSRAGVTTDNLSEFGLFVSSNDGNSNYSYKNVKMTRNGDAWAAAQQMLWAGAAVEHTVMAYAPYDAENAGVSSALTDQRTAENVVASDFIMMGIQDFIPQKDLVNKKLVVDMEHLMSKLCLKITLGSEFNVAEIPATNPISDLTVSGTKLTGTCRSNSQGLYITPTDNSATGDIQPYEAAYTAATDKLANCTADYEVILVPQIITTGEFVIRFNVGDKNFSWKAPAQLTLSSGKRYTLALTAGNDVVTAGQMSASAWVPGQGSDIETE